MKSLAARISASLLFLLTPSFGQECPIQGDGGDTTLNKLKNRRELPASYLEMGVPAFIASMPEVSIHHKYMDKFSQADRNKLDSADRISVGLVGYLVAAKQSEPEACNCHSKTNRDYHIWISPEQPPLGDKDSAKAVRAKSVIVEPTPYWQKQNKDNWRIRVFEHLAKGRAKVRISGWVMYDPEHPNELGKTRGTLWEIHPVTKVEVWSGGAWREL